MAEDAKNLPAQAAPAPPAPTVGEIAVITDGKDITRGFVIPGWPLTPQDNILRARGGNYQIYEWVAQDDQVQSTFQQRRLAVVGREYEVEPGGDSALDRKAADSLKAQLDALDWNGVTDKMLWGVFYGYGIAECIWAADGGEVVLSGVKVRKQRRFRFNEKQEPVLITFGQPLGEALPERKFWHFRTGADNDDEPYGLGLAHWLYWPVFFKRNNLKFWLVACEKFGQPTAVGKYQPGATHEDQNRLLQATRAFATETGIIIPIGTEISLLETVKGAGADYVNLYDKMDAAISKVVLSQTMTTDDGASLSQAQVHADVAESVIDADDTLISASFRAGPATWLTEWNYPGAAVPIIRRRKPDPDLAPKADLDTKLFNLGWVRDDDSFRATYGDGYVRKQVQAPPPEDGADALPPGDPGAGGGGDAAKQGDGKDGGAAASFADPEDAPHPKAADQLAAQLGDANAATVEGWVAEFAALLRDAGSLEEARDRLLELHPKMAPAQFADVMGRAVLAGDLAGRAGAKTK